ncbi:nuclear transport factor 2 family protein [Marinimicrobium locisalis]|uniref:nuclear transport factor 2 family protein n=1 Tax=Marinimicrobium locisalis TaxID=546022 RepID=UPI003221FF6E
MDHPLLNRVQTLYERFDPALVEALDQIYSDEVVFEDPLHHVEGLAALRRYFAGLVEGLDECRFEFADALTESAAGQGGQAVLFWTMHYRHRKLRGGAPLRLVGSSHLRFTDRVTYHRDYFDAGAMLYEHVPMLGFVIRKLKARLG